MSKVKAGHIISSVLKRFLLPWHLWKVISLQRNRKRTERVFDDAQLKLYSELLPGGFLHFGYFDNTSIDPGDISLNDVFRAQKRYADVLLEKLPDAKGLKVLDIGCGMGTMCRIMKDSGHFPTALTPDKTQAHHIRQLHPDIPLLECRFEDLEHQKYAAAFDVIITSESLQYLKQPIALPAIKTILKPGGLWISCDYFRIQEAHEKSGHVLTEFQKNIAAAGLRITSQRDVTPNILPTMSYVYHFTQRVGMPLYRFALGKIEVKAPGIFYALQEAIPMIKGKIDKNLLTVNPQVFASQKQYLLMQIEHA